MIDEFIDSFGRLHERIEDENRATIGPYTGRQLMMMAGLTTFEEPPTLGEFAEYSRCSYQNVRVLISLLEDDGCMLAAHDPEDGRRLRIQLTDEGKALAARVNAHMAEAKQRYVENISEEDMAAFVRVIDAIMQDEGYIKNFRL